MGKGKVNNEENGFGVRLRGMYLKGRSFVLLEEEPFFAVCR
jgi:hypothetical protein